MENAAWKLEFLADLNTDTLVFWFVHVNFVKNARNRQCSFLKAFCEARRCGLSFGLEVMKGGIFTLHPYDWL